MEQLGRGCSCVRGHLTDPPSAASSTQCGKSPQFCWSYSIQEPGERPSGRFNSWINTKHFHRCFRHGTSIGHTWSRVRQRSRWACAQHGKGKGPASPPSLSSPGMRRAPSHRRRECSLAGMSAALLKGASIAVNLEYVSRISLHYL